MSQYLLTITESESGEMIFSESFDAHDIAQRAIVLNGALAAMQEEDYYVEVTGATLREGDVIIGITGDTLPVGRILDSQTTTADKTFILAESSDGKRIITFEADRSYRIRPRTEETS